MLERNEHVQGCDLAAVGGGQIYDKAIAEKILNMSCC